MRRIPQTTSVEFHYAVKYSDEVCPNCGSRIDELGYCACGAGSD
jgi:hypothetical protein